VAKGHKGDYKPFMEALQIAYKRVKSWCSENSSTLEVSHVSIHHSSLLTFCNSQTWWWKLTFVIIISLLKSILLNLHYECRVVKTYIRSFYFQKHKMTMINVYVLNWLFCKRIIKLFAPTKCCHNMLTWNIQSEL
jgi:hypothetical protein